MTLIALLLLAIFVSLGRWQWDRAAEKRALWADFAAADGTTADGRTGTDVIALGSRSTAELPRYQRVRVRGLLDARRQFLLDNRTHEGRAGYEVLTPLVLEDGRTLLVNRGWVPFTGFRDRLPDVSMDSGAAAGAVTLSGRLDELPTAGLQSGRAAPSRESEWPKITSFPTLPQLEAAIGRSIEPRVLLLDRDAPFGYTRDWRPPGTPPERHWSYAIQWWSFAALLVVLYVLLSFRKVNRPDD
jgi:surfeit locus 1 family protein